MIRILAISIFLTALIGLHSSRAQWTPLFANSASGPAAGKIQFGIPGGVYINQAVAAQYGLPGGVYFND